MSRQKQLLFCTLASSKKKALFSSPDSPSFQTETTIRAKFLNGPKLDSAFESGFGLLGRARYEQM